ncbi:MULTISPECIES: FAD-dependent monooxygenase [unclassified Streptomyces]|uniref:FAD-dependent oxidoreductase n=1 Tax=unclassified Streptomyces TaxID=2593676 RepID=UPI002365F791|nr:MULTISPECIES: FAD-dependent monooxygenase [unclassified Streptomyces]MDF3142105.1 FAD-dependent monooxygenase [Streptomyces sp. T21Q-yed]WDF43261.1 FAD-dependent monooxygenase [Streptomyces sp. T12]
MPNDDMLLFDEQLNLRPGRDKPATEGTGVPTGIPGHLVVCRSTLRRILYLGLEKAMHFGAKVTGYRSNPDGTVAVLLDNAESVEADVLIPADGINSGVRAQRLPQVRVADLAARHQEPSFQDEATKNCVPVSAWEPSNVTVAGDAIHAMSPSCGIGADTALRDAHVQGGELRAAARGERGVADASAPMKRPCGTTGTRLFGCPRRWARR